MSQPGEEDSTLPPLPSPCPEEVPDTVFSDKATFHFPVNKDEGEDQPLSPDDPIQQLLFDRLPIPQSEKLPFYKWLITEEYERQKQERASKSDGGKTGQHEQDECGERSTIVL